LYIAIFIAIAQWYSDNLSEETKKGKEGRKRAGLYNGVLPFGVMKGEGKPALPLPDIRPLVLTGHDGALHHTTTYDGLQAIFTHYGQGETAREIARWLNHQGYRTTGSHGQHPFTKDTINIILKNRFYVGELPDGQGGWVPGQHGPLIAPEVWDRAQHVRQRYQGNPQTIPGNARVHVLGGGLLRCRTCWGEGRSMALHVAHSLKATDTARYACRGRIQGFACGQPSVDEAVLEAQVAAILEQFTLPVDYREQVVALYQQKQSQREAEGLPDPAAQRAKLAARLERQRYLYELGDWTREQYLEARQEVTRELEGIPLVPSMIPEMEVVQQLGGYVQQVRAAWNDADKAQRRMLIRTLFTTMWVDGERIVAVEPEAQFEPFFTVARHGIDGGFDPQGANMGDAKLLRDTKKPHATRDGDMRGRTGGPDRIAPGLIT
ncbi:MAG: recombinase family protein, partial [Ktedonobacterales bacterium]|nr:recombinase family protein [Ktedonobacterales bacterium]